MILKTRKFLQAIKAYSTLPPIQEQQNKSAVIGLLDAPDTSTEVLGMRADTVRPSLECAGES